ncbi:MAG: hypothetical protein COY39_02040 [Alphaproteobacteria bacterium CG_4_10_14_0_8_um_filter_37_21]|nr:MAG: hypothetical protein COY39_02040 [Alphaproteobacteria bacterium CG_4_10_14_0_8_um_filter_37_21]
MNVLIYRLSPAVKKLMVLTALNSIVFAAETPFEDPPSQVTPLAPNVQNFIATAAPSEKSQNSNVGAYKQSQICDLDGAALRTASVRAMPPSVTNYRRGSAIFSDSGCGEAFTSPDDYKLQAKTVSSPEVEEMRGLVNLESSVLSAANLSQFAKRKISVAFATEARVLSIDGGGIKGLIVLELLALMEARTGKHTTELFDMIGGTSAGALIATLLTINNPETSKPKFTACSLRDALREHYPNFFVSKWGSFCGVMKEKYKITPARKILESLAGNALFCDAIIPTFVTAFNVSGESKYHKLSILGSYLDKDRGVTVVDAALSSMSAPLFFKPHLSSDDNVYLDGGLVANNPALIAYCQAKEYFQHSSRMVLLSMGAGSFEEHTSSRKLYHTGLIDIGPALPDMFLHGQQSIIQDVLHYMPDVSDFRIDPILEGKKIELDDTSKKAMDYLSMTALRWWGENPNRVDQVVNRIVRT